MLPLAVTSGEPAGIGPELCLRLLDQRWSVPLVVLADRDLLAERARQIGLSLTLRDYVPGQPAQSNCLDVLHLPLAINSVPGQLDVANAPYVLAMLDRALAGCRAAEFSGMVTAPVHKGVINQAGIAFSGHTEYLAEKTATPRVVMMLAGAGLRVALATTHLPLKDVPAALTSTELEITLRILHADLRGKFGIDQPRILVAGLNPHAGEGGLFGHEELRIIAPAIAAARAEGIDAQGPFPPDTVFMRARRRPGHREPFDVVVAMTHDHGLIPVKYLGVEQGVNVTLGLPFVRTSPDHGTAFDIAGTGAADPASLVAALRMARALSQAAAGAASDDS